MRAVVLLMGALVACSIAAPVGAAEDASQYVRKLLNDMVDISKQSTRDRRVFYERFLTNEVDWRSPAIRALGARWQTLPEDDRRKLADWSRDSVIGTDSVMTFIQNLIFQSCAITSRSQQSEEGASIRIACTRFGSEPNFVVRFEVVRPAGAFQIIDIGYNGVSLREELSKEIFKEDAVAKHGVRPEAIVVKQ